MDKGRVAEYDTPKHLIEKSDGIFRSMCERSGDFEVLYSMATNGSSSVTTS